MVLELADLLLLDVGVEVRNGCKHLLMLLSTIDHHHLVALIDICTKHHVDWQSSVLVIHGVACLLNSSLMLLDLLANIRFHIKMIHKSHLDLEQIRNVLLLSKLLVVHSLELLAAVQFDIA